MFRIWEALREQVFGQIQIGSGVFETRSEFGSHIGLRTWGCRTFILPTSLGLRIGATPSLDNR